MVSKKATRHCLIPACLGMSIADVDNVQQIKHTMSRITVKPPSNGQQKIVTGGLKSLLQVNVLSFNCLLEIWKQINP